MPVMMLVMPENIGYGVSHNQCVKYMEERGRTDRHAANCQSALRDLRNGGHKGGMQTCSQNEIFPTETNPQPKKKT